ATQEMVRKGIHLGDMLKNIGTEVTADGGGHGGAAGFSGVGDCEAMLHICMQRTMDAFREIKRNSGSPATEE
ncbi:MAG: exopolyphosphatase, partial [Candidatus Methanomethylophilus sp.]|nr:exopolyphosphatase [Methanomethylophilus sp.]